MQRGRNGFGREKQSAVAFVSAVVRLTKYGSRSDLCLLFVEFDF
jgi:hypothetical protein